jgi:hypothetical protein
MRGDVLVDLRNIYLPEQARAAGLSYANVGGRHFRKSQSHDRTLMRFIEKLKHRKPKLVDADH